MQLMLSAHNRYRSRTYATIIYYLRMHWQRRARRGRCGADGIGRRHLASESIALIVDSRRVGLIGGSSGLRTGVAPNHLRQRQALDLRQHPGADVASHDLTDLGEGGDIALMQRPGDVGQLIIFRRDGVCRGQQGRGAEGNEISDR